MSRNGRILLFFVLFLSLRDIFVLLRDQKDDHSDDKCQNAHEDLSFAERRQIVFAGGHRNGHSDHADTRQPLPAVSNKDSNRSKQNDQEQDKRPCGPGSRSVFHFQVLLFL